MSRIHLAVLTVLLLAGCAARRARYVDPDARSRVEGTGIEARDLRTVADQMTAEILASPSIASWSGDGPPRVAVFPVQNRSRFLIDQDILTSLISDQLIQGAQGRIALVNRDQLDNIMAEREAKRDGTVDANSRLTTLAGVEYFLEGEIRSLSASDPRAQTDYVVVRFQLTDAETGVIGWSNSYEMKKEGSWGVMYQ